MTHAFYIVVVTAALCAVGACTDERRYIGEGGHVVVELRKDTEPAFANDETAIYIVEERVELPVAQPPQTALGDLTQAAKAFKDLPFPRLPWVERGDLEVQVDFKLENLDDASRFVSVTVNGFNEFDEYEPGIVVVDMEPIPDYSQWERLYDLGPKEQISGTIREDEFDEAAVDLATVVNGAPNSNQIVFFENKSETDPRSQRYVPDSIPGLAGFRLGLRTTGPGRVKLTASVRVRDVGQRLADEGAVPFPIEPELFTPVAPAPDP